MYLQIFKATACHALDVKSSNTDKNYSIPIRKIPSASADMMFVYEKFVELLLDLLKIRIHARYFFLRRDPTPNRPTSSDAITNQCCVRSPGRRRRRKGSVCELFTSSIVVNAHLYPASFTACSPSLPICSSFPKG